MQLFNTLTKKKEQFIPLDEKEIKMYVCGPTVYERPHLGNARSVVTYDLLYRVLKATYPKVTYVRNITDVDDKIINAANEQKISIDSLTQKIIELFHGDIAALNCLPPSFEPKATKHIKQMVDMIEQLIKNGHAYVAEGHVLFSVDSFKDYGKLSGRSLEEMIAGARVEVATYKKNPLDFVLWKPATQEENGFSSVFGFGRPGWHIECSAMSYAYLGSSFDIHGGGIDLQFPHHENEIAQSKCVNEYSAFAKYWVHNGFLLVNGEKMSKSLHNFTTVRQVLDSGIKGEILRLALLSTHYRKPLDFTDALIKNAKITLDKFYQILLENECSDECDDEIINDAMLALMDDLNISKFLALMHNSIKNINSKVAGNLKKMGNMIGILEMNPKEWVVDKSDTVDMENIENHIKSLIEQRDGARKNRDFKVADDLRNKINNAGYDIIDTANGYKLIVLEN